MLHIKANTNDKAVFSINNFNFTCFTWQTMSISFKASFNYLFRCYLILPSTVGWSVKKSLIL